jgi:hypothetical protein
MLTLRHSLFALAVGFVAPAESPAQGGFVPPASRELIATVVKHDHILFDAVFKTCDTTAVAAVVAEDFEFYHDKFGLVATSGSAWVKGIGEMCERQRKGTDYRARRELDSSSVKVYPLNNYGAIEMGFHRFFKLLPDGKEKLVEEALFTNVWKNDNGAWKLTRVLSYDHRDSRTP